ncbi:energy-coupling factor ABC transporter ATP-binding protein [Verrucomicrobiota bacterium]
MYILRKTEVRQGDFSLSVGDCCLKKGEIYAVTGLNGAGKTMLLELLSLMKKPSEGEMLLNGEKVNYGNSKQILCLRRRIGYLMQNPYLFNTSVLNNISMGLKLRGLSKHKIQDEVCEIMERMSILHLAKRNAHLLSGGEAKRVALARTIVLDADIYLLDEPTANVDRSNVRVVEDLIRQHNKERKVTVVLSTHSLEQAQRISKNIISVEDGAITFKSNNQS